MIFPLNDKGFARPAAAQLVEQYSDLCICTCDARENGRNDYLWFNECKLQFVLVLQAWTRLATLDCNRPLRHGAADD